MKFRNLRRKVASFGIVSALSVLCLSYQNCSRARFSVDESLKASTLSDTPVFDRDPGIDPVGSGTDNRDPGTDPTAGNDPRTPGSDPTTNTGGNDPRNPGNDPSMPNFPGFPMPPIVGTDPRLPGMDPIGGTDPRTPGNDPTTSTGGNDPRTPGNDPSTSGNPRDPGSDGSSSSKTYIEVDFVCSSLVSLHSGGKTLSDISGDVKLVFQFPKVGNSIAAQNDCVVSNVRSQMENARKIDITSCKSQIDSYKSIPYMYLVSVAATSDFKGNRVNMGTERYLKSLSMSVAFKSTNTREAACDQMGDPLLVQLTKTGAPEPIELTAPEKGVMFDLLGRRYDYQKVRTSWFATAKSENYFLVLPDKDGAVKGIDQLFGDGTVGPDKRYSKQGFAALAKHDDDRDHMITDQDAVYPNLRLWKDENLDGIAQATELFTLEEKGVLAIDLRYDRRYKEVDSHGNMVKYKSIVIMKDNSYGLVYDLWLRYISQ